MCAAERRRYTRVPVPMPSSEHPAKGGNVSELYKYTNLGRSLIKKVSLLRGKRKDGWKTVHANPSPASSSRWRSFGEPWGPTCLLKSKSCHMCGYRMNDLLSAEVLQLAACAASSLCIVTAQTLIHLHCQQCWGSHIVHASRPVKVPNTKRPMNALASVLSWARGLEQKKVPMNPHFAAVPAAVPLWVQARAHSKSLVSWRALRDGRLLCRGRDTVQLEGRKV